MTVNDRFRNFVIEALVFLSSLVLYGFTLAPTIVYGDSSKFHMHIHEFYLGIGVNDHPLYLFLGRIFTLLPLWTEAYRINLVSAVFAAAAVLMVYRIIFLLTGSRLAAYVTGAVLAVSHTFWFHAVIAEVYSLHVFFLALQFYLLLMWRKNKSSRFLYFFSFFFALSLDHLLTVLYIPAYLYFILRTEWRVLFRKRDVLYLALSFAAGISFYLIVFLISLSRGSVVDVLLEASAATHTEFMFSYPVRALIHFGLNYIKYLAYQFPFIALFVGLWGLFLLRKKHDVFIASLLIFLANVIFVINYNETSDVFALYLPSYVIFALWIGYGFNDIVDRVTARYGRSVFLCLLLSTVMPLVALSTYYFTPTLLNKLELSSTGARSLPMRDENSYYLWPPKRGYYAALNYGAKVCDTVKPDALIIADNGSLARLVLYQQVVLDRRGDIDVENIEPDDVLGTIYANITKRPMYIFSQEKEFYPVSEIKSKYDIVGYPDDLLFELVSR